MALSDKGHTVMLLGLVLILVHAYFGGQFAALWSAINPPSRNAKAPSAPKPKNKAVAATGAPANSVGATGGGYGR